MITGLDIGSTIVKKILVHEAPSTRAASSRSTGISEKNCRNRKTTMALASAGRRRACHVFTHPTRLTIV